MSSIESVKAHNCSCSLSVAIGITLFVVLYVVLKSPYITHRTLSLFQKWYVQFLMLAVIVFLQTYSLSLAIVYSLVIIALLMTIDKVIHDYSTKTVKLDSPIVETRVENIDEQIVDHINEDEQPEINGVSDDDLNNENMSNIE